MAAGIIENAVRYGIFKHVLLDDAGFSMGAALWNLDLAQEVESLEEELTLSGVHGGLIEDIDEELVDHTSKVDIISNAVRVELCKKMLLDAVGVTPESLPLTDEMSQKIKMQIELLECRKLCDRNK